jgi:predicted AlkP superfamily pyrophosphatase or phosphodiesterase
MSLHLLGALLGLLTTAANATAPQQRPPVVVVSIDGLSPDYVLEADRYGLAIPELRRLLAEGAHATAVEGVLPSVTYPSHTTLVTGVSPAKHGILYNNTFDPLARNLDGWYWYAEDLRVPTLWDAAGRAGLTTASVDWPVTVGANITHRIVQYWRTDVPDAPDDAKLARVLSSPGLLDEAQRAVGPYPSGYAFDVAADARRAAFSEWLLETRRPALHLAYFSGLDEELHESGPGSAKALAAIERLDALLGRLRAAALRSGGGRAVFAVVSDHGHSRADHELRLNEALRQAGLILLDGRGRPTDWKAIAWGSGGSSAIMLRDPRDEDTLRRVAAVLERVRALPGAPIERVLDNAQARAAGGFPEAAFVVAVKPSFSISERMEQPLVAPMLPIGEHGHLPANRAMDAVFFLVGPGVPAGRELGRVDMRDVAPTLAALLGVGLPAAEGRNLIAAAPTGSVEANSTSAGR